MKASIPMKIYYLLKRNTKPSISSWTKQGGLTEALKMQQTAKEANLKIMVGCMVATSLAMAPATILAQDADFVDLDGPLLLKHDRDYGIQFKGSQMLPISSKLWG